MLVNRLGTLLVSVIAIAALAACGEKQSSAPTAAKTAQNEPSATQPSTDAQAPADASAPQTAEAESTVTTPTETISETEDGNTESPDAPPATAQPSLRLGGPANTAPTSARFKEGTNYVKLVPAQPTNVAPGKVEVVEVFWYACGHCFNLDPAIESWRGKGKPEYVEFVRVPAMWNETTRMHARVFYTAELLGKLEELHTPIFREINIKSNPLNTVEKISAFFREHGVSNDDFQKAFSSFAVENKLQRADFLNRRYRIESVPTVVVNGKYKTDVGMAGNEQSLFALIGEIAAHEHGG